MRCSLDIMKREESLIEPDPSIDNGYLGIRVVVDPLTDDFVITAKYSHISGKQIKYTDTGNLNDGDPIDLRPFMSQVKGDLLAAGIKNYEMQEEVRIEYT